METVTAAPDESTGGSSIVKSEDGNAQPGEGRSSPPPNCAICLGRCRNKSFTDSCLHQFCFKCLLTWSRVKTECPLCKQNFKSIIHNVKSNHQYEEYPVEQPQAEARPPTSIDFNELFNVARRFRYRTTLTLPRRETLAIQQLLMQYPLAAIVDDMPPRHPALRERSRRSPADFRRTVYRHNLWAQPLPDFTGRFRDCSPDFFRYNNSQVHRLIPWLNRELFYLLNENSGHIAYVLERILELLPLHPIVSPEFRSAVHCYFGDRTDHFLHEFHCFASTPYDITGYDRHVQYSTDVRVSSVVDEVLSSSDSDHDSDIIVVSSSHPAPVPAPAPAPVPVPAPAPTPSAGPSNAPAPRYPRRRIPQPTVVPIETISHSDSDSDSSEVMVVGYIKPPHQRTPELVDLLGSDSDVVLQDTEPVRVKLSRTRPRRPASIEANVDSDSQEGRYPPIQHSRRFRLRDPPVFISPIQSPAPIPSPTPAHSPTPPQSQRSPTPRVTPTPPYSSDDDSSTSDSDTDDSSDSYVPKPKKSRRKAKAKSKSSRRSPRRRKNKKTKEKRRESKSKTGKDVKSSKTQPETPPDAPHDRPGPSGITQSRKRSADKQPRRSRESKRLKSVVKVMKREGNSSAQGQINADSSKNRADSSKSNTDVDSEASSPRPRRRASSNLRKRYDSDSSSDDNIPLNLTLARMCDKSIGD